MNKPVSPPRSAPPAPVQFAAVIGASSHAGGGPLAPPDAWNHHGAYISYADGVVVGNPVGSNMGDGSVNAEALFVNGEPVMLGGAFVETQGDTMTGPLTLWGPPTGPLEATTKAYVDGLGGGGGGIPEAPTDGRVYGRQFADWTPLAATSTALTPPANPSPGALWFDPNGLQLYVYYDDGNSAQWVVTINQVATLTAIAGLAKRTTQALAAMSKRLTELEKSNG